MIVCVCLVGMKIGKKIYEERGDGIEEKCLEFFEVSIRDKSIWDIKKVVRIRLDVDDVY